MINKILVITATLGDRDSLKKTIKSVREVGGNDVEHIIVAPEERILRIKEHYGDIRCLAERKDKNGIYAALNHGFNSFAQEYEFMTFINDDDYWLPDFRVLIDIMLKGNYDLVYGRTKYVDAYDVPLGEQTSSKRFSDFIPLMSSNIILLTQQASIIRSEWYFKLNGFDESYKLVADTKFWAKLSLENIRYRYINCCCAAYCIQKGQLSSDHETQKIEHERMLNELPAISKNKARLNKIRFRIENFVIYFKRFLFEKRISNPFLWG